MAGIVVLLLLILNRSVMRRDEFHFGLITCSRTGIDGDALVDSLRVDKLDENLTCGGVDSGRCVYSGVGSAALHGIGHEESSVTCFGEQFLIVIVA